MRGAVRSIPLLLALLAAAAVARAQGTGQVRLVVDPGHDFTFILDGSHRMQQRVIDLAEGTHRFQVWAPTRRIVDTTIYVRAGSSRELVMRLPYSPEFLAYQGEVRQHRQRMWLTKALPSFATLGAAAWTAVSVIRYDRAGRRLEEDAELYNTSADPGAIAELKDDLIPVHQQEFRRSKVMLGVSAGVFTAAAACTVWSYLRANRTPLPVFDDREKVRFDGLVWLPAADGVGGSWLAGITIPLR